MRFCALLLLILSALCGHSQGGQGTLRGRAINKGQGLELAAVTLLKTSYSTTCDSNGYFEIKNIPEGDYQMRVTYVGYENYQEEITITAGSTTQMEVVMTPLIAQLNELVITGSLKEATKLSSVTPVDVYTAKYFARAPVNNLWDALGSVNGLFADIDNGVSNTTDVQINGIEGNYTMILIDGVPAMNGLAGIYALNALPMGMIDKIEIVKGAASTLYGSDAIGGVINIVTKNAANSPVFSTNVSLTSKLETNADFVATAKLKKANALFALSAENMNYRWDIDNNHFTDIPLTNRVNFYNKWSLVRAQNRICNFYARYLFEDRFGGQTNTPGRLKGSDQYYTQWLRTNQWQAGFQYQLPVKERLLLMADYSEHYQSAWFGTSNYSGKQRTLFSQLTWNKKTDRYNDLLLGASYRFNYYSDNTGLSDDSITGHAKLLHVAGIFAEDEISITPENKLLLGVRFEYSTAAGPVAMPRLNYKWNSKNEKNVLRLGFGTGYRVPNLLNEGFGALTGSRAVVVAEKLKTESAITGNANYTRVQNLPSGILNIDFSTFCTYFINRIEPDYSEPGIITYANNSAGVLAPGFSLNTDFTFTYPLKVGAGLTYTHVVEYDRNENGEKEAERPLHSPDFTFSFFLSYNFPVPQLSLDLTGEIVSPMLLATVPNDYRPGKSPWYTLQNIQITKKFKKGVEVFFGVKNFFNFIQRDPILRPFDPFNRNITVDNPFGYTFDTTYGFTSTEGIKGFAGFKYTFK